MANTPIEQEDVATIVRAMDQEFARNVAAKDAEKLAREFYAEDARLLPPHQEPVIGKSAIQRAFETLIGAGLSGLVLQTTRVDTSGDLAYGVGTYKMTISTGAGPDMHDEGNYVVVYRRQPGGNWRAVADIFNSSLPVPSSDG